MPSTTYRKPARRRTYGERKWGPPATRSKPTGPSKRQQAGEKALADVLELFESDALPAAIAETVIARTRDTVSSRWSLGNQLLCLLAGTADAAGFRQWEAADRKVKKGAKAFYILGPKTRKIRETDKATGEETERTICSGFVGIPVFAVEDTEGRPIEDEFAPTEFPPLFEVAKRFGVSVTYAPFVARFRGYYSPGNEGIVLCSHDVRTFFHELAHAAHARVLRAKGAELVVGNHAELVAETVAATLCRLYDFEGYLRKCGDYLSAHANGKSPAVAAMRVLGDVQAVLEMILETEAEEAPHAGALPLAA
ncbi:MAG TPA: ArdC family protein [Gaiellaceae bacterium]|nr:ArdC family protein [Gaiellaceae bacterium]